MSSNMSSCEPTTTGLQQHTTAINDLVPFCTGKWQYFVTNRQTDRQADRRSKRRKTTDVNRLTECQWLLPSRVPHHQQPPQQNHWTHTRQETCHFTLITTLSVDDVKQYTLYTSQLEFVLSTVAAIVAVEHFHVAWRKRRRPSVNKL